VERQTAEALPETVYMNGTIRDQYVYHLEQCYGRLMAMRLELVKATVPFFTQMLTV